MIGTRAARQAKLPQIRTEHHVAHFFDPSSRFFTRWAAARNRTALVAVSDYVRRVVAETAPSLSNRMTVVRNGVDIRYYCPREKTESGFLAGIVCRLTAWKRVHLAIRAAALSRLDLVIVGDGEERGRLERLARALGAPVRFVGYAADPRPHMAECDVILSTSDREPLGLSVMESLSMGRPVIACDGGGMPEIVRDAETGILVSEATAEAFARALVTIRDQPQWRTSAGDRARAFVERECTIEATCDGYGAVYDRLTRAPCIADSRKIRTVSQRQGCGGLRSLSCPFRWSFAAARPSCHCSSPRGPVAVRRPTSTIFLRPTSCSAGPC